MTPTTALQTGYRAIDAMLTLGVGQRVGVFAGSGVGKTTLLAGLVKNVQADVCVLCMVGERGREAQDFWQGVLDDRTREHSVMVVASSDQPAVLRARSVLAALAHAEFFRSQGKHVLLVLDSITRYAMALREIGLAAGEPPTVRAYTPNVFAALPKVVERCGALRSGGAITAVLSVLAESDDIDDPMAETMRALLDGHLVLTRQLAERRHFPAIDVSRSVSRVFHQVTHREHRRLAAEANTLLSTYESSRTLIESGFHVEGANPVLDRAKLLHPRLMGFLRQEADAPSPHQDTIAALSEILRSSP
jgi:flagellum-specific ATP synthase